MGLETGAAAVGAVAAGVEVTGVVGVVETSGVEEAGTFGAVEISGVEEAGTFGVVETSGVEETGTFGVEGISGVVVAGGAGVSDGISVGSVVAVASGSGDAGMWVCRGSGVLLTTKEGEFVPSEVQPQKSAVMML